MTPAAGFYDSTIPHVDTGVQVEERGEGESEMVVEFVKAADGAVTDTVTLRNSLRRDRHCSYCYSRSNGAVPRPPGMSSAGAAREVRADCGAGHGSGDLDALAQERLAAEHPEWATVLEDELPGEWMRWAAEELDPEIAERMSRQWEHTSRPSDAPGGMYPGHDSLLALFSLEDPDEDEGSNQF